MTGSDQKWPLSSFICFGKKFLKFFFENFFWKLFHWFFQMSSFCPNLSSFLVYTGCRSGINHYKFNFPTLYILKKLSQVFLEWNIDVAFSKYQKNTTKQKFKISKKIEFLLVMSFLVISGHFRSGLFSPKNCLKSY